MCRVNVATCVFVPVVTSAVGYIGDAGTAGTSLHGLNHRSKDAVKDFNGTTTKYCDASIY